MYFYPMKLRFLFLSLLFLPFASLLAQPGEAGTRDDADVPEVIRTIFDKALTEGRCYENLRYMCKQIGPRLSGSEEAAEAVDWVYRLMNQMGLDRVEKQACMVPHWERGEPEFAWMEGDGIRLEASVCALGSSVGTPERGITAPVIEVFSLEEVEKLTREEVEGKIVFFNRPMEPTHLNTFHAYSGCVDQRGGGAAAAGAKGAVGVIVRSMNLRLDDYPHTGNMRYKEGIEPIPAAAISTNDAETLSHLLKEDKNTKFHLRMNCRTLPDAPSANVIGEIKGSEFPDEIIVIGGHLDSWDLGEGAQDDGAGVVQSIEVLHLFQKMGYRPKRTIRAVAFMNEENGTRGAKEYARVAEEKGERHLAGLESDRGGFTPRGFTVDSDPETLAFVQSWADWLRPYMLHEIKAGYGGVDIGPLKKQGAVLFGFLPDSQRYFDHHHAATDVFEAVNKRELELGAASMAALVYLIDRYGLSAQ